MVHFCACTTGAYCLDAESWVHGLTYPVGLHVTCGVLCRAGGRAPRGAGNAGRGGGRSPGRPRSSTGGRGGGASRLSSNSKSADKAAEKATADVEARDKWLKGLTAAERQQWGIADGAGNDRGVKAWVGESPRHAMRLAMLQDLQLPCVLCAVCPCWPGRCRQPSAVPMPGVVSRGNSAAGA